MVKFKYIIILVILSLAAYFLYFYMFQSDKSLILKQFKKLSEYISKSPGGSNFTMALKINSLSSLFADKCGIEISHNSMSGEYSGEEISSHAARGRAQFSSISLDFYDIQFDKITDDVAEITATVRFVGTLKNGKGSEETREITAKLVKIEKKWKFANFAVVEVLKK